MNTHILDVNPNKFAQTKNWETIALLCLCKLISWKMYFVDKPVLPSSNKMEIFPYLYYSLTSAIHFADFIRK